MAVATISSKYQIVIPKQVRKQLELSVGSQVSVYPIDEYKAIIVKKPDDIVTAMRGLGKEVWQALGGTEKYIKRERASWKK